MDEKSLKELDTHIREHVSYPVNREEFLAGCGNLSHVPADTRTWVEQNLPDGIYQSAEDIFHTLHMPHQH